MWTTIADVESAEALQNTIPPIDDLPAGTEVNISIELAQWAPIGGLANLAGAEWWGQQMAGAQFEVDDVSSDGWYNITIHGFAKGMPWMPFVLILVGVLGAVGIAYYVTRVYITANIVEEKKAEIAQDLFTRGYTPEQVTKVLEELKSYVPSPALDGGLGAGLAGVSAGVIIAVVGGLFLLTRK